MVFISIKELMEVRKKMSNEEEKAFESKMAAINKQIEDSTNLDEIVKLKQKRDRLALECLLNN